MCGIVWYTVVGEVWYGMVWCSVLLFSETYDSLNYF